MTQRSIEQCFHCSLIQSVLVFSLLTFIDTGPAICLKCVSKLAGAVEGANSIDTALITTTICDQTLINI